ncbi:MAG: hypothetical protein JNJ83_17435 [Verrucomicrobiaceae bacterium]|nr:hypothetical protein [Verrucomicrobiaceae bacterium]
MKGVLFALSVGLCLSSTSAEVAYEPKEGDILFQSLAHNPLIDAIEGSTRSPFSHCGIVTHSRRGWRVLEAIGPVQEIPLGHWIVQGREAKFAVYRLHKNLQPKVPDMLRAAREFLGRPYDIQYELDDAKIYCSELIYKAWKSATGEEMGKLVKLGQLDWKPHEAVIRAIAGELPLQRLMITPRDLAAAHQLKQVLPLLRHNIASAKVKQTR